MIPILAPSLLAAISFIYLFGNQGAFRFMLEWVGLKSIYGMPGMVLAMTFASFPHAVMILMAALALSDARLYEAADSLGTNERRKFFTITLPGAKYGLISACMVVFTMAVSEFGVPEGDRRQHERARGRYLQAGDRPAELFDGSGRRAGAAAAGSRRPSSSTT